MLLWGVAQVHPVHNDANETRFMQRRKRTKRTNTQTQRSEKTHPENMENKRTDAVANANRSRKAWCAGGGVSGEVVVVVGAGRTCERRKTDSRCENRGVPVPE